ncbi:MAG: thermonuclease family protein [Gammaproteobacteria bacterium]|nr:thermonuclease family protein [Gammaproteobacteria bacterium]MDJ0872547.1 thermonuclease family protein [Gammaproteobacteria bacterium]
MIRRESGFLVLATLLVASAAWADQEVCATDRMHARARVAYVYDGDTLRLSDGDKLRLIGLDTPELGRDGKASQPYARQARQAVKRLLRGRATVGLRYDAERRDRHGRQLAHLFLDDGTNLQRVLLEEGLATALVFPPNLWLQACYAEAESRARAARRGLWRLASHRPVEAKRIPRSTRGYRVVQGRVLGAESRGNGLWLDLDRRVKLRIDKEHLGLFQDYSPAELSGRRLEARGVIQPWRGQLHMRVRHPAALSVLP